MGTAPEHLGAHIAKILGVAHQLFGVHSRLAKATPPYGVRGARPIIAPGLDQGRPLTLGGPRQDQISNAVG
jgi:hypothetical protein